MSAVIIYGLDGLKKEQVIRCVSLLEEKYGLHVVAPAQVATMKGQEKKIHIVVMGLFQHGIDWRRQICGKIRDSVQEVFPETPVYDYLME